MKFNATLLIVLVAVSTGCGKEPVATTRIERPALTMVVNRAVTGNDYFYSGEIRARHEVQLGFRIGGKIVERLVEVGAQVKAGQALLRLDQGDTGLQLAAVEAQYRLAEEDVKRYRELRTRGFVSQSALDAREATLKTVAAQAGLARNQSSYTTLYADNAGVIAAIPAKRLTVRLELICAFAQRALTGAPYRSGILTLWNSLPRLGALPSFT